MNKPSVEVDIFDTTLRDGAQSLPQANQFPTGSKPEIADCIASMGVSVIEAGFPATPQDKEEVMAVAASVGQTKYDVQVWGHSVVATISRPPVIAGLSRTVPSDIETTWEAVQPAVYPRIHTFISTDAAHMAAKFPGKSPQQVLDMGIQAVRMAQDISSNHPGADIEFSAEAATTTEPKYLERVVRTIASMGIDVFNAPDTPGRRNPFWMFDFYAKVINWAMQENPDITISAHNHNDGDFATSNTFALVMAAARHSHDHDQTVKVQLETTICGMGERAGNADVFPVALSLFSQTDWPEPPVPIRFQFNPSQAVAAARAVMGFAKDHVHRQSPVVGSDINVHRSGIHSDGIIKGDYGLYTPFDPTFWGHTAHAVHQQGKYQGKAGSQAAVSKVVD